MGIMLKEKFGSVFSEMLKKSHAAAKIDETKVYEEANMELRPYMWKLLDEAFTSESGLGNIENYKAFYESVVKEGKIMFEISGVDEATAREALRLASHKLPIATKFVKKENGGESNEG